MSEPERTSCPAMSDLADPAHDLCETLKNRVEQVRRYYVQTLPGGSEPSLTTARFSATVMYMANGKMLISALEAFLQTCKNIENAV